MRRSKSWYFRNNSLFSSLTDDEFEWLEARSELISVRRKQTVWGEGDASDRLFFVRSGVVKVTRLTDDGRELTVGFFTKDEMLGEDAVFSADRREVNALAYDDTTLFAVAAADFRTLMLKNPKLGLEISRAVSRRYQRLERRVGDLLFKTAHSRLASLFLDLTENFGVRDSRGVIVNLKLTHREMAGLIGATRETVSFAILDLRKDGLIQTEAKRVIILDEHALENLAHA